MSHLRKRGANLRVYCLNTFNDHRQIIHQVALQLESAMAQNPTAAGSNAPEKPGDNYSIGVNLTADSSPRSMFLFLRLFCQGIFSSCEAWRWRLKNRVQYREEKRTSANKILSVDRITYVILAERRLRSGFLRNLSFQDSGYCSWSNISGRYPLEVSAHRLSLFLLIPESTYLVL